MQANGSIAGILDQSARGLAAFAAEQLMSRLEAAGKPSGAGFRYWHGFFEARVNDLAAAVDAQQPRLFISQVRWCRAALKARGLASDQIRDAIAALRDTIASQTGQAGDPVVQSYLDAALSDCDVDVPLPESLLDVTTPHGRLAAQFVLSVLEGQRLQACRLIADAVDRGLAVKEIYLRVLIPAVREIGRMWYLDEVTVAEEHFASDTTQTVIAQLQGRASIAPANGRTLLAASVAGNRHDIGTRVLANLFEIEGWRVVCLGGDTPGADIAQAVVDFEADLLLLSATLHTHLRAVERTIQLVRQRSDERSLRIVVGGRAFDQAPQLAQRYGADGYTRWADEAIDLARRWFGP